MSDAEFEGFLADAAREWCDRMRAGRAAREWVKVTLEAQLQDGRPLQSRLVTDATRKPGTPPR